MWKSKLTVDSYIYILVLFYAVAMPLAWIHNLPREEAEKLASELGVSVQGTLDELRKRLQEKWRALEVCLPPQITDKLPPVQTLRDVYEKDSIARRLCPS